CERIRGGNIPAPDAPAVAKPFGWFACQQAGRDDRFDRLGREARGRWRSARATRGHLHCRKLPRTRGCVHCRYVSAPRCSKQDGQLARRLGRERRQQHPATAPGLPTRRCDHPPEFLRAFVWLVCFVVAAVFSCASTNTTPSATTTSSST